MYSWQNMDTGLVDEDHRICHSRPPLDFQVFSCEDLQVNANESKGGGGNEIKGGSPLSRCSATSSYGRFCRMQVPPEGESSFRSRVFVDGRNVWLPLVAPIEVLDERRP